MTYSGRVHNGVIVLEQGARLDEGVRVRVEPLPAADDPQADADANSQLRQGLLAFSGVVKDGPSDLARNHDHYLHGTPRR
jgi:hypothetical protein